MLTAFRQKTMRKKAGSTRWDCSIGPHKLYLFHIRCFHAVFRAFLHSEGVDSRIGSNFLHNITYFREFYIFCREIVTISRIGTVWIREFMTTSCESWVEQLPGPMRMLLLDYVRILPEKMRQSLDFGPFSAYGSTGALR